MKKGYVLVDFNQLVIANFMMYQKQFESGKELDLLRHMVLNAVKMVNTKFKDKYGDLVFCCDGFQNWRKHRFSFYKANRKKMREESAVDWSSLFSFINTLRDEFKEYLPYQVLLVDGCEADDIIATICKHKEPEQHVLIFSSDKDFVQLQKYPNVDQYSPIKKQFIKNYDPLTFTKTLILQGDRSDGIPNVLSPDDTFVTEGARQNKLTKYKLQELLDDFDIDNHPDETIKTNYVRNRELIDLDYIPNDVTINIKTAWTEEQFVGRNKMFPYFTKHRLRELTEYMQDF